MNKKHYDEVAIKREKAIQLLAELSKGWSQMIYTEADFAIDRIIRDYTNKPRKDIGKSAY